jgi:hypothetical protein
MITMMLCLNVTVILLMLVMTTLFSMLHITRLVCTSTQPVLERPPIASFGLAPPRSRPRVSATCMDMIPCQHMPPKYPRRVPRGQLMHIAATSSPRSALRHGTAAASPSRGTPTR